MSEQSILGNAKAGCFVCVTARARARAFYGETLGLNLKHKDGFAIVSDSNGTTLRVSPVKYFKPQPFTVLGWEVPEIKAAVNALKQTGVEFVSVPGLPQDESGIWSPAPGIFVAWFKDPDGNMLSLAQH
jgi:catechol 2,3-dioxygenase-like lactoylglutathione lyase family enzyme